MKMKYVWLVSAVFACCSCGGSDTENLLPGGEEGGGTTPTKTQKIAYACLLYTSDAADE